MKILQCILFLLAVALISCSSKNNPISTVDSNGVFPHTYHGTSAYYAGDTLGTDFGVSITMMNISRADSVFSASVHDSLVLGGSSVTTDYKAGGNSTDHAQLQYNIAFDDGSNGVAAFNSAQKDTLIITLESFLITKFGTPFYRIYKLHR